MQKIIVDPFGVIPASDKSHVKGWALIWAQRLEAEIENRNSVYQNYSEFYVNHGVNFSGGLNLFGGFNDDVYEKSYILINAIKNGHKVYSLDYDMKDIIYINSIRKRIGAKSSSQFLTTEFADELEQTFRSFETLKMRDLNMKKAIVGDSHTLAFSTKDQAVIRINGQTLNGALTKGLKQFLEEHIDVYKYEELDLCLGSIDIRHHVFRHNVNPVYFANQYTEKVKALEDILQIPINICAPVPIEHEERKLPLTGQYKGTNFFGSSMERHKFTMDFIDALNKSHSSVVIPPSEWYNMGHKEYANEIMETGSSVHIAPIHYRSISDWNNFTREVKIKQVRVKEDKPITEIIGLQKKENVIYIKRNKL